MEMSRPLILRRLIVWSIIGTGVSSVTTQLITVREFLTQFHGNEITISMVIFCWLLLTGLGSLLTRRVEKSSLPVYTMLILGISLWPLGQIVIIRVIRDVLFSHGSAPGFYSIFFYVIIIIAPYCLLTGFVLPYAQKVLRDCCYPFSSGALYLTDSIGDIIGGALFSFILVYFLKPFSIIALTSGPLILAVLLLPVSIHRYLLFFVALFFVAVFYFCSINTSFEMQTLRKQYGNIVQYLESPYGRIVVSKEDGQYTLWESGLPVYSQFNIIRSEEKVHYPLCQLDDIKDVLLVSGGFGETVKEVEKYDPAHIDYVELDPCLTGVALKLGVIEKTAAMDIMNTDARRYIKMTDKRYDAIIIDIPDPDTFQINRLFTSEFFGLVKKVLKPEGILSMDLEYSPVYMGEERQRKIAVLYNTLLHHFQNILLIPGEEVYFLCRDGSLDIDIPARLKAKSITTSYIEGFFGGNVTAERIKQLKEATGTDNHINTDLRPELINIMFREWFTKYGTSPWYFFLIVMSITIIYLIFLRKEEYILFSTGLATMGVEMLVIFVFQIIYGYVYLKIGAIVTAFLVGLLPGVIFGSMRGKKYYIRWLGVSEILLLFLLCLFYVWITCPQQEFPSIYLFIYCLCFSFLCGFQFPIVTGIIGEEQGPAARCLAADLCGASVGTIVTGTILIPLLGIQSTVIFLIFIKISSNIIMFLPGKKSSGKHCGGFGLGHYGNT